MRIDYNSYEYSSYFMQSVTCMDIAAIPNF